jgi:DNA-binding NarL/FixJ family response regulator
MFKYFFGVCYDSDVFFLVYGMETLEFCNEKIVIVEDDKDYREMMKKRIEEISSYGVLAIDTMEQVANEFASPPLIYVLDIDLGMGKEQDGIKIGMEVKKQNPRSGVFIYAATIGLDDGARKQLWSLEPDAIFNKTDIREDCEKIIKAADYRKEYMEIAVGDNRKYLESRKKYFDNLMYLDNCFELEHFSEGEFKNRNAFEKYRDNDIWRETHLDSYVAFVNGEFIDKDRDRSTLLTRIRATVGYASKDKMIVRVENNKIDEVIDEPASLWLRFD